MLVPYRGQCGKSPKVWDVWYIPYSGNCGNLGPLRGVLAIRVWACGESLSGSCDLVIRGVLKA